MSLLTHAKSYDRAAAKTGDLQLQRDALKRIMNALVEVGVMAQLDKEEEEAAKAEAAGAVGASKRKKAFAAAQQAAKPSDILRYSPKEMDALEVHDEQWVARFGRLRALHYLERMRALAPDDDGEVHSTTGRSGSMMGYRGSTTGRGSVVTSRIATFLGRNEEDENEDKDGSDTDSDDSDASGHGPDAVDEEAEHADMLNYAHKHPPEWVLTLDTYNAVYSTRPRSAVMHLSGGTFFQEKARRRAEELASEVEANGTLAASGKTFFDYFEYGLPLAEDDDGDEEALDSGDDSDPEVKRRRTEEAAARGATAGDASAASSDEVEEAHHRMAAEKTRSKPRRRARGKVATQDDDTVVMGGGPRPVPTLKEAHEVYPQSFMGTDDEVTDGDGDVDSPLAHVAQKHDTRRVSRKPVAKPNRKMSERK